MPKIVIEGMEKQPKPKLTKKEKMEVLDKTNILIERMRKEGKSTEEIADALCESMKDL